MTHYLYKKAKKKANKTVPYQPIHSYLFRSSSPPWEFRCYKFGGEAKI